MIKQEAPRYFCDGCEQEIRAPFGPLVVDLTAPHFAAVRILRHFCDTDCASKWIKERAGEVLS